MPHSLKKTKTKNIPAHQMLAWDDLTADESFWEVGCIETPKKHNYANLHFKYYRWAFHSISFFFRFCPSIDLCQQSIKTGITINCSSIRWQKIQ